MNDYIERELRKNIFAKSSSGGSWGDVLINCDRLISYLNNEMSDKRVLLISQGSVLQGLRLLTHMTSYPWEGYSSSALFSLESNGDFSGYGRIECIYDKDAFAQNFAGTTALPDKNPK